VFISLLRSNCRSLRQDDAAAAIEPLGQPVATTRSSNVWLEGESDLSSSCLKDVPGEDGDDGQTQSLAAESSVF